MRTRMASRVEIYYFSKGKGVLVSVPSNETTTMYSRMFHDHCISTYKLSKEFVGPFKDAIATSPILLSGTACDPDILHYYSYLCNCTVLQGLPFVEYTTDISEMPEISLLRHGNDLSLFSGNIGKNILILVNDEAAKLEKCKTLKDCNAAGLSYLINTMFYNISCAKAMDLERKKFMNTYEHSISVVGTANRADFVEQVLKAYAN